MDIEPGECGGEVVTLYANDDLDAVPESHRDLVTPDVREVFADPLGYFREVAEKAKKPFPNMAKWLHALLRKKVWVLQLVKGDHPSLVQAGFYLAPPKGVKGAWIGPPMPFDPTYPEGLAAFYRLIGFVDWNGVEYAGKFDPPDREPLRHSTLAYLNYTGTTVNAETTRIIGGSLCGDMMICTADGQGGWWKHETGEVVLRGTITEFINWAFGELLDDCRPESDEILRGKKKRRWF